MIEEFTCIKAKLKIAKKLKAKDLLNNSKSTKHHFYVSNYTKSFEKSAKFFFKETIKLEEINLFN